MTDKANLLGFAPMKQEGVIADWATGEPVSAAQAAAYKERIALERAIRQQFWAEIKKLPAVLTPAWLAVQHKLALQGDDEDMLVCLRDLVLSCMASGQIERPQECAAIVMPMGD